MLRLSCLIMLLSMVASQLEEVKPDIKKRKSTHDDDYDAALLSAFELARPSKRSKQLENVAGIAGHELACSNAELI